MFSNNCEEEDFDFNLDDVVKINNTLSIQQSQIATESSNLPENVLSKSNYQPPRDDWGSDDDSHFLEIKLPKSLKSNSSHVLAVESIKEGCSVKKNDQLISSKSLVEENVVDVQIRKFPGPAGVLLPLSNQTSASKSRGQQVQKRKRNLEVRFT